MKVFNKMAPWPTKVNFVDENNVILGYDMQQNCCEYADWFITDDICTNTPSNIKQMQPKELPGYTFDTTFCEKVTNTNAFDDGAMMIFRLIKQDQPNQYIHIFNCHNGYYAHGFEFAQLELRLVNMQTGFI